MTPPTPAARTPRPPRTAGLRRVAAGAAALAATLSSPLLAPAAHADTAATTTAVTVAGDLDTLLGCATEWAADCAQARMTPQPGGIWTLTAHLPAGSYTYKAALNDSWEVSYGLHGASGGANIPLTVPAGGAAVTFLFDQNTHWITDTVSDPVPVAVGDFEHALGCADWAADCVQSWLEDPDGDGTYTFTTSALPAGSYQARTALGLTGAVGYGQDGTPGGAADSFTVATDDATTTFSYNTTSHQLSVYPGPAKPSLVKAQAYWLSTGYIAWDLGADPAGQSYQLAASGDGGLAAGGTGLTGGTTVPLSYDPAGLPAALKAKFPDLAGLGALRVPAEYARQAAELLRGQVAVAAMDAHGQLTAATSLQTAGVLDDVYAANAARTRFGPVFHGRTPTLTVWAPTARNVDVELYDGPDATTPTTVPMTRDPRTGAWSVTGKPNWNGDYYRYQVTVWVPDELRVMTNQVTDPYSLALNADSTRSQIVDLDDPALIPASFADSRSPKPIPSTQQEIQELSVRDFSEADTTVPAAERGTYLAFTDTGSAGMKHLEALAKAGVTTVQIMPTFDFAGVPQVRADQAQPPCDLAGFAPDSDQQQACVAETQSTDGYNWGYNPVHFTVPEGAYATDSTGAARTVQLRDMVAALHKAGLRVVMDVVYNHTAASGEDPESVLDQIVPGYYQRLDANGAVTTDSCCADTAPENAMMNKLVVDSVTTWAKEYHIDGFRFDLMGLDPKSTMLDVRSALDKLTPSRDGIDGKAETLYGEGWNFGVVANDARFVQATQANMAGTGIGTFNDRLRDAVRGGSPFDTDPRVQGFGSGQYTEPNGDPVNGTPAQQRTTLLHDTDLVELGLTGDLADYRFTDTEGSRVTGSGVDYNGVPAGYTAAPGEAVDYVDAHDNLALYDTLAYKLAADTSPADRARIQALALATSTLGQGPGFAQAGTDLLRSKSLDSNSYDSGDWFNDIQWNCADGNGFGHGLPMAASNQAQWPYAQPLLANPALVPTCAATQDSSDEFQQYLEIKRSSPLFSLTTAKAVQQRVSFPLSGTGGQVPGVITEHLDGRGLGGYASVTVVYNATGAAQTQTIGGLAGTRQTLDPVQADGADPVVKQSAFDRATGSFTVPGYTVAVFVQR